MKNLAVNIKKYLVLVIIELLILSFWTVTGQAAVDADESASAEVVERLNMGAEISAKIAAIFSEYEPKIRTAEKTSDDAFNTYLDAKFDVILKKSTEAIATAAKEKSDEETNKYRAIYHERDLKIKRALSPALAAKYTLGMKIITERNAKYQNVSEEHFMKLKKDYGEMRQRTEEERKNDDLELNRKYHAIEKEYSNKLDEQVGKVK